VKLACGGAVPDRLRPGPSTEFQEWLAGVLPNAVNTVLPDSGHFPPLAHPTRLARVLAHTARWPE
jgi:pimeloyl-ACP methyl ester carboxylesterase